MKQEDWGNTDVGIYQIKPNPSPVKLLSKLTPGLFCSKLCCCISTSFEVSHSMQQFGITGFFEFSHHPVLHSQGSTCSLHSLYQIHNKYFKLDKHVDIWVIFLFFFIFFIFSNSLTSVLERMVRLKIKQIFGDMLRFTRAPILLAYQIYFNVGRAANREVMPML